ncbi:MAG: hypothetical protein IRY99_04110 [Isosphaeraceae bacterium]|nr:hypothetical protein [Isosphaeraceae bacterium]
MHRFATIALSLALLLGLNAAGRLLAQDEKKEAQQEETKKDNAQKDESKKDESKKDESKSEAAKPAAPPTIPPEVQAKLDAARKAVAEAIVAAEKAGLVKTSIQDPPPIMDILARGYTDDADVLKAKLDELKANPNADPEAGLSPEVFGAWWTNHGKMEGVVPEKHVRIIQPSKGLIDLYNARAKALEPYLAEARKAQSGEAAKKEEAQSKEETKTEEKAEPKKDESKAEPKKDEPKAEEKKDEPKAENQDDAKAGKAEGESPQ